MNTTILIVDDNRRNIEIIERLLRNDYNILTAESGERALEIAESDRPDIILLDIMMPGLNGYEVCRQLRSQSRHARTKIIMVSAKALTAERLEGYQAGADDYVTKPFDLDELEAKVKVYARLNVEENTKATIAGLLTRLSERIGPPLSFLQESVDLLAGDEAIRERHRDVIRIGQHSVTAIRRADDEIRLLSDLEMDRCVPRIVPAQPQDLLARASDDLAWTESGAGCRFETEVHGQGLVTVDERMIVTAMGALINLGMRHCEAGGLVSAILRLDDVCRLRVVLDAHGTDLKADGRLEMSIGYRIARCVAELHDGRVAADFHPSGQLELRLEIPLNEPAVVM